MSKKHYLRDALEYLDTNLVGIRRGSSRHAALITEVRSSAKPTKTAKRLVRSLQKQSDKRSALDEAPLDFSDLVELEVKLIRKFGGILPEQEPRLLKLHRAIAAGSLTRETLNHHTRGLLAFHNTLRHNKAQELAAVLPVSAEEFGKVPILRLPDTPSAAGANDSKTAGNPHTLIKGPRERLVEPV